MKEIGRCGGAGWSLTIGSGDSPFGRMTWVEGPFGIFRLGFGPPDGMRIEARRSWPEADLRDDGRRSSSVVEAILDSDADSPVGVVGTAFQIEVWRALRRIPRGTTITYGGLARGIGRPGAARAVGAAVAANRIAWLIPCHRVVRADGSPGGYFWGPARKRAMLAWENDREH